MKQLYEYLLGKKTVKKTRSFGNASLDSLYDNAKSFSTCKNDKTIEDIFDNFEFFIEKRYNIDKLFDCINRIIDDYVKDDKATLEISTSDGRNDRSNIRRHDFIIKFELFKIQISFWEKWAIFGVKFISKHKPNQAISFEKKAICWLKSTAYWHWTETIDDKHIEIASSVIDTWIRVNK